MLCVGAQLLGQFIAILLTDFRNFCMILRFVQLRVTVKRLNIHSAELLKTKN